MRYIPLYIDNKDLETVIQFLNDDTEIAFILNNGQGKKSKWIAVKSIDNCDLDRYCLWHIPSGPLPLLSKGIFKRKQIIKDPFLGWEEKVTGAEPSTPYFGPGHNGIIWFNNKTKDPEKIGCSSFEWIGGYYEVPLDLTKKWWEKLRKTIKSLSVKIPRTNTEWEAKPEVFAFKNALKMIEGGMPRDIS